MTYAHPIVDAHLDLGYNIEKGRDLTQTAQEIRDREKRTDQISMVTLPDLERGGVALVFAAVFVTPTAFAQKRDPEFNADDAKRAKQQVEWYLRFEEEGRVRLVRDKASLNDHLRQWRDDGKVGLMITLEGMEMIESPEELGWWFDHGVRSMSQWGPSRYGGGFSGGQGTPGGFSPMGRELLAGMQERGVIMDLAHGSVELMHEAVEICAPGTVCLTHTTPRKYMPRDRMPDEALMKMIADHGGVVGLGLGNGFISEAWRQGDRTPVPLSAFAAVIEHMAGAAGWDHVGLGSDIDGGIGLEETPPELDTIADLHKLSDLLPAESAQAVMGGNWIRFLENSLR